MSGVLDSLISVANDTGRPVSEVIRHHFLEAALRRLPNGGEPAFALRGSMVTRLWAAPFPRIANDLDFLGTFPHSVEDTARRFLPPLCADAGDEVRFDLRRCTAKGIWPDSEFPGVRLTLFADVLGEPHTTAVDVGFGDPLVPDAGPVEYPFLDGGVGRVWAVHPATMIAWKLHGLAEWGHTRWRPKDMLDLWLLLANLEGERRGTAPPIAHPPGSPDTLAGAIRVAFTSRHCDPVTARSTLGDATWETFAAQGKWNRFREEFADLPIPESLAAVRGEIVTRLAAALDLVTPD